MKLDKLGRSLLTASRLYPLARASMHWMDKHAPSRLSSRKKCLRLYAGFIKQGDLCFDVGAHVGLRTSVFLELGARAVCVEPQSACVRVLEKAFGHRSDVAIVAEGLGECEGWAELAICRDRPTISTMEQKWRTSGRFAREYAWDQTERIHVTTLDALVERFGRPTFCKIDVEGHEAAVLKGLSQPVPCLSFEFTREFLDDARKCATHLRSIGDYEFNASLGGSWELVEPAWCDASSLLSLLESIDDSQLVGDVYARLRGS